MKRRINALLERFFQIRFIRSKQIPNRISKYNNSVIIEFIGPGGTGKTTLRDYFLKKYFKQPHFIDEDFNYISELNTPSLKSYFKDDTLYNQLLNSSINDINKWPLNGYEKLNRLIFAKNVLIREIIASNFIESKMIFFDEGLFRYFSVYFKQRLSTKQIEVLAKKRIIINCFASSNTIYNRANNKPRIKKDINKISKQKRLENINREIKNYNNMIDYISTLNIPILNINTENDMDENCKAIQTFISNHINVS